MAHIGVSNLTIIGSDNGLSPGRCQAQCENYSGTRLTQNDKHEYTKNIVLEYYTSADFSVLVFVCLVLSPALAKPLSEPMLEYC